MISQRWMCRLALAASAYALARTGAMTSLFPLGLIVVDCSLELVIMLVKLGRDMK